jgi:hypothetical protein
VTDNEDDVIEVLDVDEALEFAELQGYDPGDPNKDVIFARMRAAEDASMSYDEYDAYLKVGRRERIRRRVQRDINAEELEAARGERVKRTAEEYAKVEQPTAILDDVLAAEVNLLGGPTEAGKSILARDWAVAVMTGDACAITSPRCPARRFSWPRRGCTTSIGVGSSTPSGRRSKRCCTSSRCR